MNQIYEDLPSANSYDQAYQDLMNLCGEIKTIIQQNPALNSGQLAQMF